MNWPRKSNSRSNSISQRSYTQIAQVAQLDRLGPAPYVVLTGAGLSTASGIPAYRDALGAWRHPPPIQHQSFIRSEATRRRYWARSYYGWQTMANATPNTGHLALASLQARGVVSTIVTQNVDGLHQRAGADPVIELHGSVHQVVCLGCHAQFSRALVQEWLIALNPELAHRDDRPFAAAPDGDALVHDDVIHPFAVPHCPECSGVLKPDVVFFGDNVPGDRVERACNAVREANTLLVVGSSLTVFSGFRFARLAHALGKPVVAINQGVTRADALLTLKIDADCGEALQALARTLNTGDGSGAIAEPSV